MVTLALWESMYQQKVTQTLSSHQSLRSTTGLNAAILANMSTFFAFSLETVDEGMSLLAITHLKCIHFSTLDDKCISTHIAFVANAWESIFSRPSIFYNRFLPHLGSREFAGAYPSCLLEIVFRKNLFDHCTIVQRFCKILLKRACRSAKESGSLLHHLCKRRAQSFFANLT